MSNKAVSVYAEARKREQEEQSSNLSTQPTTQPNSTGHEQLPQEVSREKTSEEKPIFQAKPQEEISQEKSPSRDSYPASTLDSKLSRYQDSSIEFLRKSVRFS